MTSDQISPLFVITAALAIHQDAELLTPLCEILRLAAPDIDWQAVHWVATERIRLRLNKPERIEVVRRLAHKINATELGELLGVDQRSIERYKSELRDHGYRLVIAA